jgi:Zn-dependent protease
MNSMLGGRSIKLARVLGVRIGVDPSWFVVLFLLIWLLSGAFRGALPGSDEVLPFALAVLTALLFFASVVVHELGHAVVARRNGISIAGIDLWLFGGLARMRSEPRSAGVDFRIAAAGPLATLVVVLIAVGGGLALAGLDGFRAALALRPQNGGAAAAAVVLGYLAQINALLLVFNLLPGLPLDGGRIARAIAWKLTGDRTRATRIAAGLGRVFSFLLIGLGIFAAVAVPGAVIAGLWLAVIGFFIGQAARSAVAQSTLTAGLERLEVKDVMDGEPVTATADGSLERAYEERFLRYGWQWFPVVDGDGRFVGLLSREDVEGVPEAERSERRAADLVREGSARTFGVRTDEPLEALLGSEPLRRLGAVMAVDGDGVLRGVLTLDHLKRALRPAG